MKMLRYLWQVKRQGLHQPHVLAQCVLLGPDASAGGRGTLVVVCFIGTSYGTRLLLASGKGFSGTALPSRHAGCLLGI
jgi:hypothetical protein